MLDCDRPSPATRLRRRSRRGWCARIGRAASVVFAGSVTLAGCRSEERVVHYKPFFAGLDGAQFGGQAPVISDENRVRPAMPWDPASDQPDQIAGNRLIVDNPDGSRRLVLASPLHVMRLLELLLDDEQDRLIIEQLFSERTVAEFGGEGKSVQQAVDYLRQHRRDIAVLFARMPLAENSPTVIVDQPGDRVWIIRLTGRPAENLRFTRLWVRLERGQWKFLWVT